ncbi:MAG: hypothetical protein KAT65_23770 [Methanophagales archaeon]|nr:hypothetical protein [Methanophagales archaeon]
MIKKIKKIYAWVQKDPILSGLVSSLITGIALIIVGAVIGGKTFSMVYDTLMNLDFFNTSGAFFLIISAVLGVLYVKQRWKASIVKINSKLEDMTKEYNELYEKTKPPFSTDKLIKAEVKHNPTGKVGIEGDPPYLIFDICVVNRTNYSFKPKEVFLKCYSYYPKDLVFRAEWEDRAKSQQIYPTELQSGEDGNIQFHVPKEKIDGSKRKFTLGGYVEYITEEGIIHEDLRKTVKVNITKLEYTLDEETAPEPKGRVLIAK